MLGALANIQLWNRHTEDTEHLQYPHRKSPAAASSWANPPTPQLLAPTDLFSVPVLPPLQDVM